MRKASMEMIKAQKTDPMSLIVNADLGAALISAGRYEEAEKHLTRTLELEERFAPAIGLWEKPIAARAL